ncbi:transposase family protein, partial [Hymenobacter rubripertinctus]
YAKDKEAFLRAELGLELGGGIPSQDTLGRVVRFLKPSELEKSLRSACQQVMGDRMKPTKEKGRA